MNELCDNKGGDGYGPCLLKKGHTGPCMDQSDKDDGEKGDWFIELPTQTIADVSTVHITPQDVELLKALAPDGGPFIIYNKSPYGWYVFVAYEEDILSETLEELEEAGFSAEFRNLVALANRQGCKWIELDVDGAEIEGLPRT